MSTLPNHLAHGRAADVYMGDETHILKLFHPWFERGSIEYEQVIRRTVHASGVKAPAVGEIVQVNERDGLIYERIARASMLYLTLRETESGHLSNPLLKTFTKILHSTYPRRYFRLCPGGQEEYRRWLPIVAVACLSENNPH